jgi:hypothetical protein
MLLSALGLLQMRLRSYLMVSLKLQADHLWKLELTFSKANKVLVAK